MRHDLQQHIQRAIRIGIVGGVFLTFYDMIMTVWNGDIRLFILGDLLRIFFVPLVIYILLCVLIMLVIGTVLFFLYRINDLPETPIAHTSFQSGIFAFIATFYILFDVLNVRAAAKPLSAYWEIAVISIIVAAGVGCVMYLLGRFVRRRILRVAILASPIVLLVALSAVDIIRSHVLPKAFFTLSQKPKVITSEGDSTKAADTKRTNVLWIVIDTLRADHVSSYGYSRQTTPNIDEFAKESTRYTNAISAAPWTLPSHAAMLTGMYVSRNGADGAWPWLADEFTTLPELLRQYGYQTYGFSNNDNFGPKSNLTQGFDKYILFNRADGLQGQLLLARTIRTFLFTIKAKGDFLGLVSLYQFITDQNPRQDYGAAQTVGAIKESVGAAGSENKPFFIMANFMEVHDPYGDSPEGSRYLKELSKPVSLEEARAKEELLTDDVYAYIAGKTTLSADDDALLTAMYDGDIHYVDSQLQEVFQALRERKILDSTLVIVTSDHGENLGDHGLIDHVYDIHRSLTHVPLIVRLPGRFTAGATVDHLVQSVDLFPTILDIAGITDWPRKDLQGLSLLGTEQRTFAVSEAEYANDTFTRTRYVLPRFPGVDERLFGGSWKSLTEGENEYIETPNKQLVYNVSKDPDEANDLAARQPKLVTRLRGTLLGWLQTFPNYLHTFFNQ